MPEPRPRSAHGPGHCCSDSADPWAALRGPLSGTRAVQVPTLSGGPGRLDGGHRGVAGSRTGGDALGQDTPGDKQAASRSASGRAAGNAPAKVHLGAPRISGFSPSLSRALPPLQEEPPCGVGGHLPLGSPIAKRLVLPRMTVRFQGSEVSDGDTCHPEGAAVIVIRVEEGRLSEAP